MMSPWRQLPEGLSCRCGHPTGAGFQGAAGLGFLSSSSDCPEGNGTRPRPPGMDAEAAVRAAAAMPSQSAVPCGPAVNLEVPHVLPQGPGPGTGGLTSDNGGAADGGAPQGAVSPGPGGGAL